MTGFPDPGLIWRQLRRVAAAMILVAAWQAVFSPALPS